MATVTARSNRELYASPWYVNYPTLVANKDLLVDGPTRTAPEGRMACRRIKVTASGSLVVTRPDGTNQTLTGLVAGETLDIQAVAIIAAGTTVTSCIVHW